MNVRCDGCETVYRVDPDRVPAGGVRARCHRCGAIFRVARPERELVAATTEAAPAPVPESPAEPAVAPEPPTGAGRDLPSDSTAPPAAPTGAAPRSPGFGPSDPVARARRIARALVSDIVVYHPERHQQSLEAGTLRVEFREEILRSWEEYVEQVGEELAKGSSHFRDALNEILARGQNVF